jgi:hypothetical protein
MKIGGALFLKSGNERPFIGDRAIGAWGQEETSRRFNQWQLDVTCRKTRDLSA